MVFLEHFPLAGRGEFSERTVCDGWTHHPTRQIFNTPQVEKPEVIPLLASCVHKA